MARGDVYVINITFPEGLTIAEMAKIFETHGLGPAAAFIGGGARSRRRSRQLDPAARDLEGYLFPETYPLPRKTRRRAARSADDGPLRAGVDARHLRQAAEAQGLTVRQVVTLASIVEKETSRAGRAAARGGGLRQPPAHRHAAAVRSDGHLTRSQRAGQYTGNLRRDDLAFDSPYNTYRYPGSAAGSDRLAGPRVARSRGRIPPPSTFCTSSAATTARTSSPGRSTSTIGTCRSGRCSTSGIRGHGARG